MTLGSFQGPDFSQRVLIPTLVLSIPLLGLQVYVHLSICITTYKFVVLCCVVVFTSWMTMQVVLLKKFVTQLDFFGVYFYYVRHANMLQ